MLVVNAAVPHPEMKKKQKKGDIHHFGDECPLLFGEGGIRTLGSASATSVFETDPIGHSGTSPAGVGHDYRSLRGSREDGFSTFPGLPA